MSSGEAVATEWNQPSPAAPAIRYGMAFKQVPQSRDVARCSAWSTSDAGHPGRASARVWRDVPNRGQTACLVRQLRRNLRHFPPDARFPHDFRAASNPVSPVLAVASRSPCRSAGPSEPVANRSCSWWSVVSIVVVNHATTTFRTEYHDLRRQDA